MATIKQNPIIIDIGDQSESDALKNLSVVDEEARRLGNQVDLAIFSKQRH